MLTVYLPGDICHLDTALYPPERVCQWPYAWFVKDAEGIQTKCISEVKPQTHNVAYNLNRNLWAISALPTKKLQI